MKGSGLCNDSVTVRFAKIGLTVDAVNDGVRSSFRNLGTVMTDWMVMTVQMVLSKNRKKARKWLFSPHF